MLAVDPPPRCARPRSSLTLAFLAGAVLVSCATVRDPGATRSAHASAGTALDLYEAGEFVLAAERFEGAARQAALAHAADLERKSMTGACLAWLHARRLAELAACSRRLETLQRRARRPDPSVNTLVALGAVAGDRPLPPLRVPTAVRPLVRAVAREDR